jgi:RNA 3'-terminal phosphate cyclase (ATP)
MREGLIQIDGSEGEGGGQILRSSLSLAIRTQQPFQISNIRAGRERPGLLRQHLTAVKAAAEISGATVTGAHIGSRELTFHPGKVQPGAYCFAIGTAGSCTLVLQTVLPPLLCAAAPSTVRITGGTHNSGAPPFEFLERVFLPLLARMGATVTLELERHGFYPRGGGALRASIVPFTQPRSLELHERGHGIRRYAEAHIAALPISIGHRELEVIGRELGWSAGQLKLRGLPNDAGPGNVLTLTAEHEHVCEVITGFGERGVRAESIASAAALQMHEYLTGCAPVGEHLADQLLLPMALGRGGSFTTTKVSQHLRSNARIVERFTDWRVTIEPVVGGYGVSVQHQRQ